MAPLGRALLRLEKPLPQNEQAMALQEKPEDPCGPPLPQNEKPVARSEEAMARRE
jgi:hypothetical protein